jgi:TnpA family transposase
MIFGTMHLLGFSYAPRIKNLKRQRLYTFKSRRVWDRAQVKVAPSGYIDTQIIEDNWDDMLRQGSAQQTFLIAAAPACRVS